MTIIRLDQARLRAFGGNQARACRAGQFYRSAVFGVSRAAAWCRDNGVIVTRAQSEAVNSAGGVLVPDEIDDEVIALRAAVGVFRREARVRPMASDVRSMPRRTGGITVYPVGEGVAPTESQLSADAVGLTAKKWAALMIESSELEDDAIAAFGEFVTEEIAFGLADAEDAAGFAGDGTHNYNGIRGLRKLFADGAGSFVGAVTAASNHDTFAEIDGTDLATMMAALPEQFWDTAKWYCSAYAIALTFARLGMTAGGSIMTPSGPRPMLSYLGFPIVPTPKMPGSGDQSGAAMILFGDLRKAATLGDRRGVTVKRSTDYRFANDQVAILATERFDIVNHDIGDASAAGAIVALMGN
jgi:HK97 family phage major capsid protein